MPLNKGRSRVIGLASETTPLIDPATDAVRHDQRKNLSRRPVPILFATLVVVLSILASAILLLTLLASSFKPSLSELSSLPHTALLYQPPESVTVLNITDRGVLVNVTLRCGINADQALGVNRYSATQRASAAAKGERGGGAVWWETLRRWTARRILTQLPMSHVHATVPDKVLVFADEPLASPLLAVTLMERLSIPLVSDVPEELPIDWLPFTSVLALARPTDTSGQIWHFVQHSWIDRQFRVRVDVPRAEVKLPDNGPWWTKLARMEKEAIQMSLSVPMPHLPGIPAPGTPLNVSSVITLRDYSFQTQLDPTALIIAASATVPNFVPSENISIPFALPFAISLPARDSDAPDELMALVMNDPVNARSGSKTIELKMAGHVIANLSVLSGESSPLSLFLQNYLHGKDNLVSIQGVSHLPIFAPASPDPPAWMLSSLPSLSFDWKFPGPRPRPKIIQSVTIEKMRISESGGKMKASGIVVAQAELPSAMQLIKVDIREVLPDVLVFDGPAPDDDGDSATNDLPPRAFGHIQPLEFLQSTTSPSGDPRYPHRLVVTAPLNNVDLDVLPGRDSVLSDFVSKVIFKGGAQAGVKGTASVKVAIAGVQGEVRLDDLPVQGEFWVGKQNRILSL